MDNKTSTTSPTDTAMLLAGIAAAVVSVVYSLKHVKKSKCCAGFFSCEGAPVKILYKVECLTPNSSHKSFAFRYSFLSPVTLSIIRNL